MKHEITITGAGICCKAESDTEYDFAFILSELKLYCDGEDITSKKGKYIKDTTWIYDNYVTDKEAESWTLKIVHDTKELASKFIIETDEFDAKKLQLIKSTYEVCQIPYGIVIDTIMYDGKKIVVEDCYEYDENFTTYFDTYEDYIIPKNN